MVQARGGISPVIALVVSPCPHLQMLGVDAQTVVTSVANHVIK
jgi:hypothetical protein